MWASPARSRAARSARARRRSHRRGHPHAVPVGGGRLVFINAFYQLRSTHALAQALLQSLGSPGAPSRDSVVVRDASAAGDFAEDDGGGRLLLYTPSLSEATARVRLAVVDAMSRSRREWHAMTILVGSDLRILIQGITGTTGRLFAEKMVAHGTLARGRSHPRQSAALWRCGLARVLDSHARSSNGPRERGAVLSCIAPQYAVDGIFEVVDAGIPLACLYIENIPVHDAIKMCSYANAGARAHARAEFRRLAAGGPRRTCPI